MYTPLTLLTLSTLALSVATEASESLSRPNAHSVQSFSSHVPALFHTDRDMATMSTTSTTRVCYEVNLLSCNARQS